MLFRYAEEYPAINGGDEFGMNYIFTNRNKNSGLQAAEFHNVLNVTKVYNVLQTMLKALRYERYKPYKLFIDCVFRFPII